MADAEQTGNSGLALLADLEQAGIFLLVYSEQAEEMGVGGSVGTRMNTELSAVTTGSVHGKTGMKQSLSKLISASSVLVEGVGLHVIPSYVTSRSTGTRNVPG